MGLDGRSHQSFGKITSGIEKGKLPLQTINFVRRQLPVWRDDPHRVNEQSEPKLNLQLCKFLARQARDDFPMVQFIHEELQGGHRSVDISVTAIESKLYSTYDPFIVFECKRLPAPSRDREKEYVTGEGAKKSGGIQRFKLGPYAAELQVVGMIGYVQKHSAQHWHSTINRWISELSQATTRDSCAWSEHDRLVNFKQDLTSGVANCKSLHSRTGSVTNIDLTIYHLWVVMNASIQEESKD